MLEWSSLHCWASFWRKSHWKWEIKEFAKMTTSSPIFGRYELFQIKYLDTKFGKIHFLAYIWYELIIQRRQTFLIALFSWSSSRLAEWCEKSEGTSWTDSYINSANIFDDRIEKKYLGNICTQNGCSDEKIIFYFFSQQVKTAK